MEAIIRKINAKTIAQRITANFIWSVLSEVSSKGIFFVANLYLARILAIENYGLFTLAQTFTFYVWLAVDLGIYMYGIREIAKNPADCEDIINPLITVRVVSGLVLFAMYEATLLVINISTVQLLAFTGCGLYLVTQSFNSDWALRGLEKFNLIALGNLLSSIVFFVGILYLVNNSDDIIIATFIWSLSFCLGNILLILLLFKVLGIKIIPVFTLKVWAYHLKKSIYFSVSGSFILLYNYIPIFLLSIFFTDYEVGIYSASFKIVITCCHLSSLIMLCFYPILSGLYQENKPLFFRILKIYFIFMAGFGLLLAFFAIAQNEKIILFLLTEKYRETIPIFRVLAWLVPIYCLENVFGTALQLTGFQRLHSASSFCGIIIVLLLGLASAYMQNVVEIAASLVVARFIVISLMAFLFYNKVYKIYLQDMGSL